MKEKIKQFIEQKKELEKELTAYCCDKSIPLDERWEVFELSGMGSIRGWTSNCPAIDKMLEDDESYEKHKTYYYSNMIGDFEANDPRTIEIKEYALATFEIGFVFDW